jgi:PKD repeat protein
MHKLLFYLLIFAAIILSISCSEDPTQPTPTTKGTLNGKITDQSSGADILNAMIITQPATDTVSSDSVGNYSITNIEAGSYTVTASKNGFSSKSVNTNVTAGETTTVNISLTTTTGSIKGKIFDQNSGNGISGVTVVTQPATVTVTSDSDGDYLIPNLEPGNYIINVTKPGYYPNSMDGDVIAGETITKNISLTSIPVTIASFSYAGPTVTPAIITFENSSQNADTYLWDFGDGSTSTEENPVYTYYMYGVYTITLKVTYTVTGLSDSISHDITLTPGNVYVDTLWLLSFPPTKPGGASWDLFDGPDVYANIVDSVGNIFYQTPNFKENLEPGDLPTFWNLSGVQITNWAKTYFVELWDDDTGLLENDYMGITGGFKVNQLTTTYPTEVELQNTSGNLKVKLILMWQ